MGKKAKAGKDSQGPVPSGPPPSYGAGLIPDAGMAGNDSYSYSYNNQLPMPASNPIQNTTYSSYESEARGRPQKEKKKKKKDKKNKPTVHVVVRRNSSPSPVRTYEKCRWKKPLKRMMKQQPIMFFFCWFMIFAIVGGIIGGIYYGVNCFNRGHSLECINEGKNCC